MALEGRKTNYLLPVMLVIVIFTATFSLYFYFRGATEENIRATLLEQYEQRQIDSTITLSKSIASDLDLLMTKLQVLAQSGPLQAGDFTSEETNLLMKRIYDESNTITRIEGIGISNANNIVTNVYQPEIDKNQLIGQDMSSRPFVIEARGNLPGPTFSSGFETIINNQGQRVALLHPIYDDQGTHIGWVRSAIDASLFFERYGNVRDIDSEHFSVLDRRGNILVTPLFHLEGMNIADEEVRSQVAHNILMDEYLQKALLGQTGAAVFPEPFGETINTGYPIVIRGEPIYFVFLSTPTSMIYSQIEDTLFGLKVQTVTLLAVASSSISIVVILLTRMNSILHKAVKERTNELEFASARLESLNDELEMMNRQLVLYNKDLEEKDEKLEKTMTKVLEAGKEKEEFSAMITHELRTPLTPIIGYGSMLLHGKFGELPSVQKKKLQIMYDNAVRLDDLVQDVLDAQKLQLGVLRLEVKQASVKHIVEQSINSLKAQAEAKGIRLVNNLDLDLALTCDSGRIIQVLTNLISNGLKFSHENEEIEIAARLNEGCVVFSVKDNGAGIPEDKQSKLFTKFYQADTSLNRKPGGTGLGLAICKGIVEAHDGRIWFESQVGKGSIFSFSIPVGRELDKEKSSRS